MGKIELPLSALHVVPSHSISIKFKLDGRGIDNESIEVKSQESLIIIEDALKQRVDFMTLYLTTIEVCQPMRKRSLAWDHFTIENEWAKCKKCPTKYKFCHSTSNLLQHLKTEHGINTRQEETELTPLSENDQQIYFKHIINLIIQDLEPINCINHLGLRALFPPNYTFPSSKTIKKYIMTLYKDLLVQLQTKVKNEALFVSISVDGWTSRTKESFLGLTLHYINNDWCLTSMVCNLLVYYEFHSAQNMADFLVPHIKNWVLDLHNVVSITTDNGANMVSMVRDFMQIDHIGCAAHTLQLVISNGIQSVKTELIQKCRNIVSLFSRSPKKTQALIEKWKMVKPNEPQKKLKMDVCTRWNSIYYMLSRLCEAKLPLINLAAELSKLNDIILTDFEWIRVEQLLLCLKPFEEVTTIFSGASYITVSLIGPVIYSLQHKLEKAKTLITSTTIQVVHHQLQLGLKERFNKWPHAILLATRLDPRFKCMPGFSGVDRANSKILLQNEYQKLPNSINEGNDVKETFFKELFQSIPHVHDELLRYENLPIVEDSINPLEWWKLNEKVYPKISKLAKKYLCITATSVPSEVLFSKAGLVISNKRATLKPSIASAIVFLNAHKDKI